MKEPFAVAILAAGLGTRFKSRRAKLLHSAGGRTLIEHAVRTARSLSPQVAFVIVGHQAEEVIEAAGKAANGLVLRFVHQTEQRGTGHALLCGRGELESAAPRLLVWYGDAPLIRAETLRRLQDFHRQAGAAATVMTTQLEDPTGYGRILRASDGSVASVVEEKSASSEERAMREINTGIYCFETKTLFAALEQLQPDAKTGEYYLTDAVGWLSRSGKRVMPFPAADAQEVMGVNTRVELAQADGLLRERKARELMLAGVTIYCPETVVVDPDVEVGSDTVIEPGAALLGSTRVGENCRIGCYCVITDSELADGVRVEAHSILHQARVASGAVIGPFARLRPGAEIGPEAKIGNFVEVKQARVGRNSRAQHLTYLGDAIVGENVNVGAGTITCNYDGEKKNQTVIEDGSFIGSGTELVAPVRVGKGSYVAAGSTITEDVPPDSLALARARQSNKEGWVRERKKKVGKRGAKS